MDIEKTYERHFGAVYRLCLMHTKNVADAEDAAQDVFYKLMRRDREFDSAEHEIAWLIRVASTTSLDLLRRKYRTDTELPEHMPAHKGTDHSGLSDVAGAVLALPDKLKTAVYLHYYEGYSSAEIAQITGFPHSTIRGRLSDARLRLKEILGEDFLNE
ncbi:MAG: RNA polymerase sigma factor [Oscillospiraceae bacterium]|jgi:RNA polymerase sigma-70 factor (ECF subfamily)|nr:RNA polymerase sigma factor [Oscillospiraceae bacterium]